MYTIDKAMQFVKMMLKFQAINRLVFIPSTSRYENDVEHSYFLAMLGWYLVDAYKLPHDLHKVMCYAMVHDLVEVYAGDTNPFNANQRDSKKEREELALKRLREEFSDMTGILEYVEKYEKQDDTESRFVYSLDKLMPSILNHLDGGKAWRDLNLTLDQVAAKKFERMKDPMVIEMFKDHMLQLRAEEEKLFGQKNA